MGHPNPIANAILPHCPYPWRDWADGAMMWRRLGAAQRGAYQARANRASRRAVGQCHRQHEVGNSRCNLGAKTRSVENAVMSNTRLQPMGLAIRRNIDAQTMRRFGLPNARNVVVLAFDGEQRHALDRGWINAASAMAHLAPRQSMAHEHRVHRLQIKFRGQIHHREVFVVEFLVLLRRIAVATHQIEKLLLERLDVPLELHADEAVELKETRIDVAREARNGKWHLANDMGAEPIDATFLG